MVSASEQEIIYGCLRNEALYQKALFNTYAPKFMTVCIRYSNDEMEAEDILQEGFVRIFNYLHQYKFEGSFEGWMRRIVVNVALKRLQKKKIKFSEITHSVESSVSVNSSAYSRLGEAEILNLISQLPDGYKLVFNLNVIEGYSHEEIAKMLDIQSSTSRSQLVKARKMLQQKIANLETVRL